MTAFIIMTILGIMLSVANANAWFIVPEYCIWICFGISAVLFIIWICNLVSTKREIWKMNRRF